MRRGVLKYSRDEVMIRFADLHSYIDGMESLSCGCAGLKNFSTEKDRGPVLATNFLLRVITTFLPAPVKSSNDCLNVLVPLDAICIGHSSLKRGNTMTK